jgi:hypothetical protein
MVRHRVPDGEEGSAAAHWRAHNCSRGAESSLFGAFLRRDVGVRELPEAGPPRGIRRDAHDEHPAFVPHDGRGARNGNGRTTTRQFGQLVRDARDSGPTRLSNRTHFASGRTRRAHRRAELHQSLIEIAGRVFRDELSRDLPQSFLQRRPRRIAAKGEEPAEDAHDVAVDQGDALPVRDARNRSRRIGAYTRKRPQLGGCLRQ